MSLLSQQIPLAYAYLQAGQPEQAAPLCRNMMALHPTHGDVIRLQIGVYLGLNQLDQAQNLLEKTLKEQPNEADFWGYLGVVQHRQQQYETAIHHFNRSIAIQPTLNALAQRSLCHRTLGNLTQAKQDADAAWQMAPHRFQQNWNLANLCLLMGDYAAGWRLWEWRKQGNHPPMTFQGLSAWQGSPSSLKNKTLLIHPEQGLGDTIQFIRYLDLVKQQGAKVVFTTQKALFRLLYQHPSIDILVNEGNTIPHVDYHCPLMSLPFYFETRLDSIPATVPYLTADPQAVQIWRKRLDQLNQLNHPKTTTPRFKIGLVWEGGHHAHSFEWGAVNARRNVAFSLLAQTFQALNDLDIDFYSLQKGEPAESEIKGRELVYFPKGNFYNVADELHDFADTAALIMNLDLVISVDTSTAHLAAALGKPTWILNRFDTCWRWLLDREDSPWYPTVQLYRQRTFGEGWDEVLERVTEALKHHIQRFSHPFWLRQAYHCYQTQAWTQAETLCQKLMPCLDTWRMQGLIALAQNQLDQAYDHFKKAQQHHPNEIDLYANLILILYKKADYDQVVQLGLQALALQPYHEAIHRHLAMCYRALAQYDQAIQHELILLQRNPHDALALYNLGVTYDLNQAPHQAIEALHQALHLRPNWHEAQINLTNSYYNLGVQHYLKGQRHQAITCFEQVLKDQPDHLDARWNLALSALSIGDFEKGWQGYEVRWQQHTLKHSPYPKALLWQGQSLNHQIVVVHAEQGMGDTLQFCRYVPLLVKLGAAKVIFQVQKPLVRWLSSMLPEVHVIGDGAVPAYDVHIPLLSLPLRFQTRLDSIPPPLPNDPTPHTTTKTTKTTKTTTKKIKIGLVWHGGHRPDRPDLWAVNARRNVDFSLLAQTFQALNDLDIDFYSLQKGEPAESEIKGRELDYFPKGNFYNEVDTLNDFADTAALIMNLDLVISVDTSTAHLAATLGKPTWILNRFDTCWRWLLDREDSPWYPTVKLYRQRTLEEGWGGVLERVRTDLIAYIRKTPNCVASAGALRLAANANEST